MFNFWSGDATGTTNPLTITLTTNKIVIANFDSTAVTILVQGQGTVSKAPDKAFYNLGEQVTLNAMAGRWFAFTRWGDGPTANPRVITIGLSNRYTAIFSPTTAVETLTFGNVSRAAPVGMPAIFVDGEFIVTNAVTRFGSAEIAMQTTFPNGTILYTTDGSEPSYFSSIYNGPFTLQSSATIQALAYDANFTVSSEADPVAVTIVPLYSLTATTAGGGAIALSPTTGPYVGDTQVSLVATSAPGWTFLQWLGDVSGSNPTNHTPMTTDKCVEAMFGTALSTVTNGNGSIIVDAIAPIYPYGHRVRLTAVPQAGNSFALWGNATSDTNNPLRFVITNANPTVSCLFAPLSAGQVTLTVIESGRGQVFISPRANRYPTGQVVTLAALAEPGQTFLGWSGDAGGTQSNLVVTLNQSKVITANFTRRVRLEAWECAGQVSEDGFQLRFAGELGQRVEIDQSADLATWTLLAALTNNFGTVQVTAPFATGVSQRFYRARSVP